MQYILMFLAVVCVGSSVFAGGDRLLRSDVDAGMKLLLSRYAGAVLTIKATSTLRVSADVGGTQKAMREREVPVHGLATVVNSDGVLISALSFFDASAAMDGRTINGPNGRKATLDVSMDSVEQLKLLLADGTEVPCEMLLKDTTLDLVVIRANADAWRKAGGDKLPVVDLTQAGTAEVLDQVLVVGLTGPSMGYEQLGSLSGIMVKTTKPRVIYRPSFALKGGPAFTHDGRVLGIGAHHMHQDKLTKDIVIVPAADVAEFLRQAMAVAVKQGSS